MNMFARDPWTVMDPISEFSELPQEFISIKREVMIEIGIETKNHFI